MTFALSYWYDVESRDYFENVLGVLECLWKNDSPCCWLFDFRDTVHTLLYLKNSMFFDK